jgi:RHS repeat-associated protein
LGTSTTYRRATTTKFTGKERDTESNLDYFGARHYASNLGRFMTPDWSEDPVPVPFASLEEPQTLNLYGYVRNNPTTTADPDGHFTAVCPCGCGASACIRDEDVSTAWKSFVVMIGLVWDVATKTFTVPTKSAPQTATPAAQSTPADPNKKDDDKNKNVKRVTNPKHNPNSASPEPRNAQELFDKSIADKSGVRWAKDSDGTIHRFSAPSNGESHWNGSTAGANPIRENNIPIEIRRALN